MAVQAMVGPLAGEVESTWVDKILEHIGGRNVDYEYIDLRYAELLEEAGVEVRGFTRVLLAKRVKMQALIICSLLSLSNLVRIHSFA